MSLSVFKLVKRFLPGVLLMLLAGILVRSVIDDRGTENSALATQTSVVADSDELATVTNKELSNRSRVVDDEPVESSTDADDLDEPLTHSQLNQTSALEAALTRIQQLELRVSELELASVEERAANDNANFQLEREQRLTEAGFEEEELLQLKQVQNKFRMERLELLDRASREGWLNSAEFTSANRNLARQNRVRQTLGDERYDLYLYTGEENNRVQIGEVIDGSAAQQAGILPGDVIRSYADSRVFQLFELRQLTTSGQRDELVNLSILREGEELQLVLPRGPLGVTVSGTRLEPR